MAPVQELTDLEKEHILRQLHASYLVYKNIEYIPEHNWFVAKDVELNCSCNSESIMLHDQSISFIPQICPRCGRRISSKLSEKKEYEQALEIRGDIYINAHNVNQNMNASLPYIPKLPEKDVIKSNFLYLRKTVDEEGEEFLQILRLTVNIALKKGVAGYKWTVNAVIDIKPNHKSTAYKIVKGSPVPIDAFDALNINSQNIKNGFCLVYDSNETNIIDYLLTNKNLNKYIGFIELSNSLDVLVHKTSMFAMYIALFTKYPVVEILVKMKYIPLLNNMFTQMMRCDNADKINKAAESFNKLLHPEATSGAKALVVPKYVADDLINREAPIDEYVFWGDVAALSPTEISRENYMKLARNPDVIEYRSRNRMIDIMKYGYKLSDIIWYLNKQPHTFVISMWYDYLNMCDQMGIEADRYPQDIKVAHDTVMAAFQAKETQYLDARLNDIASKIESSKVIPESDGYIIKIPHSSRDFVAEGQAQHNCVGSYLSLIHI